MVHPFQAKTAYSAVFAFKFSSFLTQLVTRFGGNLARGSYHSANIE
jgi:hypothetical protein